MKASIRLKAGVPIHLPATGGAPKQVHVFAELEILAIQTAIAARRALLVRGEPGTGKTQLARAAANALQRAFVSYVVDSRTESRDLLWHFDAVARLAEAQVLGAKGADATTADAALKVTKFIHPRPIWWAFAWGEAAKRAAKLKIPAPATPVGWTPADGAVVLIDEIDKGEADVPNGLLEALGAGEFTPPGQIEPVRAQAGANPPLVIITTNEERRLPDAFVRRCVVLNLGLPTDSDGLIAYLVERGAAHFPKMHRTIIKETAQRLAQDRATSQERGWRPLPGQAEFIDLLRVVNELAPTNLKRQRAIVEQSARFVFHKHRTTP